MTHELMHALGFFHEHTRPDRDKFVKILWNNIKSGDYHLLVNFGKTSYPFFSSLSALYYA